MQPSEHISLECGTLINLSAPALEQIGTVKTKFNVKSKSANATNFTKLDVGKSGKIYSYILHGFPSALRILKKKMNCKQIL